MTYTTVPKNRPSNVDVDRSLTKWESLNQILSAVRKPFPLLGLSFLEAMDASERQKYNETRIKFMASEMIIQTGTIRRLIELFTKADVMNCGSLVGRRGVMISGPASSGKSTACLALLEYYLALYERRNPGAIAEGAVPAVYISVPATRTVKATLQRIARFLALPVRKSDTETDLAAMLQEALHAMETKIIVLDEIQMLNGAESTLRPAVNNLKDLTNYFEGTIVYSGLNLEGSGLLFGDAGLQLKQRVFKVDAMDFSGKSDRLSAPEVAEWSNIVCGFTRELPLYATSTDVAAADCTWLHGFTGGNIGTLKAVMFDAARSLILQNDPLREDITREVLAESIRDYAAEDGAEVSTASLQGSAHRRILVENAT